MKGMQNLKIQELSHEITWWWILLNFPILSRPKSSLIVASYVSLLILAMSAAARVEFYFSSWLIQTKVDLMS